MISRLSKIIFLFALVGFSTMTFENVTLQTSVNNITNESNINSDNTIDMEIFTALVYLLAILGFAIFVLILIVNHTHLNLIDGIYNSKKPSITNS